MSGADQPGTPPDFVRELYGYRVKNGKVTEYPNCSDSDNQPSVKISAAILEQLDVKSDTRGPPDPGRALETQVEKWLRLSLPQLMPQREWQVDRERLITEFRQYQHLTNLQDIVNKYPELRTELGTDYLVKPDVTVGLTVAVGTLLHASVSCKWTIRSDRVQNIRHEAVVLTRHRRGRQPHIVAVTAEPLPSRIASIARGTGEVDAVYHVALDFLREAVNEHGSPDQRETLMELVSQERLFDINALPETLAE